MLFTSLQGGLPEACGGRAPRARGRMDTFLHRKANGSNTPHAARRIGSEPLVRWGFALGYRFVYSVCFAQTAALQREGRAPWVCSRGRVRQGCSRCSSVVSEE